MVISNIFSQRMGKLLLIVLATAFFASPVFAAQGNIDNGKKLYTKKCWWCHGKTGEADGPAAGFMIPPPRDFSLGVYKYKTSPFDADFDLPRDEDLFRAITDGLPGTAMPSWKQILNEQERWDLVAYIKSLTDMFEEAENPAPINYGGKIASTPESIEKGKKAFQEAKCYECHGKTGKGSLIKKLKEDSGARVWPRNFTKPWTFRGGYTPEAIFSRVTAGIPNTPMPSFAADKTGKGKLSEEDRWHVVNYVMSLADPRRAVQEGMTVVKGAPTPELPKDEKDPVWDTIESTAFYLVPQIIQKDRFFTPSNDLIIVKAAFNDQDIAFLLEVDDRTKSLVGDKIAETLAWGELHSDAIAIQFPVDIPKASEKPYFGHGDGSHAVSMMYWSSGTADAPNTSAMFTATGTHKREDSDTTAAKFTVSASWEDGTWKVMMKRSLTTPNKDKDVQFEAGRYIPIAFANWDGSNGESGSKHTLTTWYWLLLQPESGSRVVVWPGAIFLILVVGQFLLAARLRKNS